MSCKVLNYIEILHSSIRAGEEPSVFLCSLMTKAGKFMRIQNHPDHVILERKTMCSLKYPKDIFHVIYENYPDC